jgi:hypothetical protein
MFVALGEARYHDLPTGQQGAVQASSPTIGGKRQPGSVVLEVLLRVLLGSSEETMTTRLAAIVLTLLFAAVSLTGRAEAGASASAPSKNTRASQLAAQQSSQHTAKNDFGITEYSSSSARNHSH